MKTISKPTTGATKAAKAQKIEKAIRAVAQVVNLPAERIVGDMIMLPDYSTARLLLVQLFMDDCKLNRHTVQRLFKFSSGTAAQNSYNKGKRNYQTIPAFQAMLKQSRQLLKSS